MSSLIVGRHYSENMVGNIRANFNIPLIARYLHKSKHHKSSSMNIMAFISMLLEISKRIDNKWGVHPRAVYWSLWCSALFVFAIATISLEMQWISSLMTSWNWPKS